MKKRVFILSMFVVAFSVIYFVEAAPNCQQYNQFSREYRFCACMAKGFSERCCSLESAAVDDPGCLAEAGATKGATPASQSESKESDESTIKTSATYKKVYKTEQNCFQSGIDSASECMEYARTLYVKALEKRAKCPDSACKKEWLAKANQIAAAARKALKDSQRAQKIESAKKQVPSVREIKTTTVKSIPNKNLQRSAK